MLLPLLTLTLLSHLNPSGASSHPQVTLQSVRHQDGSASNGCQLSRLPHEFRTKHKKLGLSFAGYNRTFHFFIPESYQSGVPTPLILSFHGRGKTAAQQQNLTGFSTDSDPAYNPGWIVVTPQGIKVGITTANLLIIGLTDCRELGKVLHTL
jgi:poly(3-hydroxybutyrate) depolymerase